MRKVHNKEIFVEDGYLYIILSTDVQSLGDTSGKVFLNSTQNTVKYKKYSIKYNKYNKSIVSRNNYLYVYYF